MNKPQENAAFMIISAGEGGLDAQDWAAMLSRMYMAWADSHYYIGGIVTETTSANGWLERAVISIHGAGVYRRLLSEIGAHKLVRLSPFDPAHRRHSSFALVGVRNSISGAAATSDAADSANVIRSYVMHPYRRVTDLRTNHEEEDVGKVLNGKLDALMDAYMLRWGPHE